MRFPLRKHFLPRAERARYPLHVAATLLLGALACNREGTSAAPVVDGGPKTISEAVTPQQASQVLARVGDRTITLGDYVAVLEHLDQFDRLRYQSPERRKELLNEMINMELLAQEATARGYDQEPAAQQERRAILRDAMLAEARKGAPSPNDIPEADVRAYYDAHAADYRDPERRRLSIIVLKDEATARSVLEAARKATTAAQWGELVQKNSVDSLARVNVPIDLAGDMGFVSPPGDERGTNARIPEPVRAASYAIPKVGEVLDHYVKVGDRFYLVRLTQISEARSRNLQEAERAIRVKLAQERVELRERELLNQLRAELPIQLDEQALAQVKVPDGTDRAGTPSQPPKDADHPH